MEIEIIEKEKADNGENASISNIYNGQKLSEII